MRRPIIAGNWKMNKTIAGTKELVTDLIPLVADAEAEVPGHGDRAGIAGGRTGRTLHQRHRCRMA